MNAATVHVGDAATVLRTLPDASVHCCVTSPPYWGLRDYGVAGQIGLEPTVHDWLDQLVAVFDEVRRVLRPDGTLWLNVGDAYAGQGGGSNGQHGGLRRWRPGGRTTTKIGFARKQRLEAGDLECNVGHVRATLRGLGSRVRCVVNGAQGLAKWQLAGAGT